MMTHGKHLRMLFTLGSSQQSSLADHSNSGYSRLLKPKVLSVQIFVLSSSRIQQRGYDTLFNYTTANPNSGVSKFVKQFPLKRQVRTVVAPLNVLPGCCIQACAYTAALFLLVPSLPE